MPPPGEARGSLESNLIEPNPLTDGAAPAPDISSTALVRGRHFGYQRGYAI